MNFGDFLLLHAQGLVSVLVAVAIILFLSWLLLKYVVDEEAVTWIRRGRTILLLLVVVFWLLSIIESASVSLPRTTIDRSAGDDAQRTAQHNLQN